MTSRKTTSIITKEQESKENEGRTQIKVAERPTFILKTREGESRAVSPSQRNGCSNKKEGDNTVASTSKTTEPTRILLPEPEQMTSCIKFMDESMQLMENPLDYLHDQQDFLVVGVIGSQGVGKSTILSLLASNDASKIFPIQSLFHHESATNCTNGIDLYVTKNRVIYLDTQPILSCDVMDMTTPTSEQKKNATDFATSESNIELQSLQFSAFLYSICHVVIFVQDWFVDPNLVRFIQAAEMLKPASTSSLDQDYIEHYPHLLILHNKAGLHDFQPKSMETMKRFYNRAFVTSRLQTQSGLDMSSDTTEGNLNLFLIPEMESDDYPKFYENHKDLIDKLRTKIHGVSRTPMTSTPLTEKNWYHYVSKVIDALEKSHVSSEYARLLP